MIKKALILGCILICATLYINIFFIDEATAVPGPPMTAHGTTKDTAGKSISDGIVVRAMVVDPWGNENFTQAITSGTCGPLNINDTDKGRSGYPIHFFIGSFNATPSPVPTFTTGYNEINLTITDIPRITDNSDSDGTTGDPFTFNVTIGEYVDSADNLTVKVNWTHGTNPGFVGVNDTMTNTGGNNTNGFYFNKTITLDLNSIADLTYTIHVNDTSGNSNSSGPHTVAVTDNDDPSLDAYNNASSGTTGDSFEFNVTATDNIAVASVNVSWSHDTLSGNKPLSNTGGNYWAASVTLDDSISSMTFAVQVNDSSSRSTAGTLQTVSVTDNDDPSLVNDTSANTGTTGDSFTFYVNTSDNVDVASVNASWSHGSLSGNKALSESPANNWTGSITLDDNTSSMTYRVQVNDSSGNSVLNATETVTVTDNDYPTVTNNTGTSYTGDDLTFNITATDNIDVTSAYVIYRQHRVADGWTSWSADTIMIEGANNWWTNVSSILGNATYLEYYFNISDGTNMVYYYTGNANTTDESTAQGSPYNKSVTDNDKPSSSVSAISPYLQNTTLVTITTTGSDNASGIKNVTLYYYYSNDNSTANFTGPFLYDVNNTLPWTTSFYSLLANESGYYRFYSIAVDNATNVEDAPADNDTMCYCNAPPDAPSDPYPENVTGVNTFNTTVTLSVYAFDPDADGMTIYFYNNATAQEIGNTSVSSGELLGAYAYCSWTGLNESTNYSWYAVANDSHLDNTSEVWTFTTGENEVILFEYHVETLTGDYQCLGVEFDGEYFWVTGGNNTNDPNRLYKFNSSGSLVADYSQPAFSTDWGWKDLAFDGTYLYASLGGNVSNQINQINCTTGQWTESNISGPENGTRGLAYDPDTDHFWSANWSSSIYKFNRSGDITNTYNNTYSIYGLAWDNVSSGGPWLWVYAQNCSQNGTPDVQILQFDPDAGTYTNVTYQGLYYDPEDVAGGACFVENWEGKNVFVGLTQNTPDLIFGMKLNRAPNETSSPTPSNRSTGVSRTTDLGWTGGDPDGDTVTYDVYFGTSSSPSKVGSGNQSAVTYDPGTLSYSTVYYWKIATWDNQSAKTEGPVWHFTTVAESSGGTPTPGPSNNAPTADANGPYTDYVNQSISFNGTGSSDPDTGDTLTYTWDFGDNTTGTGATPAHTYNSTGLYNVTLTVSDGTTTDSDTTTANISELPAEQHLPVADANGPYPGLTYQNITFDGSDSSDSDGTIANYTWDFDDGDTGYGINPTHAYTTAGTFNVTLAVKDNDNLTDSNTTTATIALDSDGDGWSDDMETSYGTNATNATDYPTDADGDGTPDEDSPDGNYTGDPDDDNDGLDDEIEQELGLDSNNASDVKNIDDNITGGYLVDTNGDGTYDKFYNSTSGINTTTKLEDDGTYKIDTNGDGTWDYIYDPASGAVTSYEPEEEFPWTIVMIIAMMLVIIIIIIAVLLKTGYLYFEEKPKKKK